MKLDMTVQDNCEFFKPMNQIWCCPIWPQKSKMAAISKFSCTNHINKPHILHLNIVKGKYI